VEAISTVYKVIILVTAVVHVLTINVFKAQVVGMDHPMEYSIYLG